MPSNNLRIELVEEAGSARKPLELVETWSVDLDTIQAGFIETFKLLNTRQFGNGTAELHKKLIRTGQNRCDALLPRNIKERLRNIKDGQYLTLEIDDSLSHIPWELLCVDDKFLCERFNMGRIVKTDQNSPVNIRKLSEPLKMWIVADPTQDLDDARIEAGEIRRLFSRNRIAVETNTIVTADDIREKIKSADFYHFTGHAEKDGLILGKGKFKALTDTANFQGGASMPYLLFINACESAWWQEESEEFPSGLARAFTHAGSMHYIGASWKIISGPSKKFAITFYKELLDGVAIGQALRTARLKLKNLNEENKNICWASYRLNGDPTDIIIKSKNSNPAIVNNILKIQQISHSEEKIKPKQEQVDEKQNDNISEINPPSREPENLKREPTLKGIPKKRTIQKPILRWAAIIIFAAIILAGILVKFWFAPAPQPSSHPLTLAVLVDDSIPSVLNLHIDYFIGSAIEKQILDNTEIILLERRRLDDLEREKEITIDYKKRPDQFLDWIKGDSDIIPAQLFLFLYVNKVDDETYVVMDLIDAVKRAKINIFLEKLEGEKLVSGQIERLSGNLIEKLKEHYPLIIKP
ncbi:CHAT domain-containing protein [Desulfococcaceae bacterium HSG9]|nr:CHAT domain-containing protein [Desulfococcaceae bacterium HSG9]